MIPELRRKFALTPHNNPRLCRTFCVSEDNVPVPCLCYFLFSSVPLYSKTRTYITRRPCPVSPAWSLIELTAAMPYIIASLFFYCKAISFPPPYFFLMCGYTDQGYSNVNVFILLPALVQTGTITWISWDIHISYVSSIKDVKKISSLIPVMAWRRRGDKPLPESMMIFSYANSKKYNISTTVSNQHCRLCRGTEQEAIAWTNGDIFLCQQNDIRSDKLHFMSSYYYQGSLESLMDIP